MCVPVLKKILQLLVIRRSSDTRYLVSEMLLKSASRRQSSTPTAPGRALRVCVNLTSLLGWPRYSAISETIPGAGYLEYFISAITLVFLLGLSAFGLLFLAAGGFLVASSQVLRLGFQLGFGRLPRVLDCFVAHSFLHDRVAIVTINQSRRDKVQAES
jgi:hypothetical protein